MTTSDNQEFLTISQIQQRLQIGRSTAYSLVATRSIPSIRVGKCLRIRRSDLERFIEDNRY